MDKQLMSAMSFTLYFYIPAPCNTRAKNNSKEPGSAGATVTRLHLCDIMIGRRVLMPMGDTALWLKPLSSSETASGASRMLNHLRNR